MRHLITAVCALAIGGVGSNCEAQPSPAAEAAEAVTAAKKPGPVVLGQRLTPRVITDPEQGGLAVGVVAVPEAWRFQSRVEWSYGNTSNPVSLAWAAENPDGPEAVYAYPAARFFMLRPDLGYYRLGRSYLGMVYARPVKPLVALVTFIQRARAGAPNLRFIGSKDLPGLPAALKFTLSPNQRGVGVKVSYGPEAHPLEEEFYAVFDPVDIPYDGPQGRTWQTNWSLYVHSFRAPAGTLDARRPLFAAVARSYRPNPAWKQRLAAVNAYLNEQYNRQLQAGYDSIAAAGRLSQQISANNDAMIASIERQRQAAPSTGSSTARTSADTFDDYVRGVVTVDDPAYGTSQRSANQQFHWTDGYGNYRDSNDNSYDPNRTEVGSWQEMPASR